VAAATHMKRPKRCHDRVSLVVITRDRVDDLLRTLSRLTALPERPRIVLVDNDSSDGTVAAVLRRFPTVDVIALPDNRGSAARNAGVAAVSTPYVAFSDDDSWWQPGSLERAADLLDANPTLALVNGHILVNQDEHPDPTCVEMAHSPLPLGRGQPGRAVLSFIACGVVMRRRAFLDVGGYRRELMIGGEEELMGWDLAAAGWAMSYVPDVVAYHHPSPRRDAGGRHAQEIKNVLWTTWLRRPARPAWRRTLRLLRDLPHDRATATAVLGALAGLPRIIARRRVGPPHIEELRRLLEDAPAKDRRPAGAT
jgi:N-acetylglucosaminyl-diphospho-decaprenol L-rhamnosyltransferase